MKSVQIKYRIQSESIAQCHNIRFLITLKRNLNNIQQHNVILNTQNNISMMKWLFVSLLYFIEATSYSNEEAVKAQIK